MQRISIMNRMAALSLAFAAVGAVGVAGAQVTPPAPGALRPYVFPKVEQFTLSNGLKVILVEKHTLPVVEGRVIIDAGAMREPSSKNGLASLTGRLLPEGTGNLTGAAFALAMESMGASYQAGGLFNNSFADVVALKNVFPDALALAAQTVIAPSFPENEFGRVKNQALAAYQQRRAQASGLASDAFIRAAFDSTAPFSRPTAGTTATITGLTRDDVVNWHRTMFAPSAATLLLVGDITPAEARDVAQRAFGGWTASRAAMGVVSNPVQKYTGTRIIIADRPNSVQSSVMIGQAGFQATDPDYIGMLALNHVLGGAVSSRLNTNLREKHGYTYGIFSGLDLRAGAGAYQVSSEVRTNATDSALVEAIREYGRMVSEPVPATRRGEQPRLRLPELGADGAGAHRSSPESHRLGSAGGLLRHLSRASGGGDAGGCTEGCNGQAYTQQPGHRCRRRCLQDRSADPGAQFWNGRGLGRKRKQASVTSSICC